MGEVHIGARALHVLNLLGFGSPIPVPGEEGGNFLVKMISNCLPSRRGRGGGGRHPLIKPYRLRVILTSLQGAGDHRGRTGAHPEAPPFPAQHPTIAQVLRLRQRDGTRKHWKELDEIKQTVDEIKQTVDEI
jgi:hypothetical protein